MSSYMPFEILNTVTDPKENVNTSPVMSPKNQEQTGLPFRKFPQDTWSSSYKYADIVQQLVGLILGVNTAGNNQNEEEVIDMLTHCCKNCSGKQLHCSKNTSQLDRKRIMSVLKDFTAVLPNKPGNAHYRHWKQKSLLFCLLLVKW